MKKLTALLLAILLVLGLFTGCASTDETASTEQKPTAEGGTAASQETAVNDGETGDSGEWNGEVSHIVMTWLTAGTDNEYLDKVAEVVNAYTEKKIGVTVEFKQVSVFEAASQYTMWIGGGEQVDLMALAYTGISPFIQYNMLMSLDSYLDSCPHIQALYAEGKPVYDFDPAEGIHGIAALAQYYGSGGAMQVFTDVLEATGLDYKDGDIVSIDEIDTIVRAVKANNPDAYVGVFGSAPRAGYTFTNDCLGATVASGVILGTDSTEVVNFFETEEYCKYLEILRGWYLDGMILKDAATTDATDAGSMINDSNCLMMWNEGDPALTLNYEQRTERDISNLFTKEIYYPSINASNGVYWTVPVTSTQPEAALRFLDLLYSDEFVYNTLIYGVEGYNWDFIEGTKNVQSNLENYYWSLAIYGDQALLYNQGDTDVSEELDVWNETAISNKTAGFGFCYDATGMTDQITAIEAIINQYRPALETGSADLETVYPDFIAKLKAAGIDDVIADKQAQLDAWLAAN